ncbi:MAG: dimethyladenosine transferase, 16S rRNA (adenine1518-N6/adenine1519-N6)-dimethyltransferase [candidate division Kazan bacterium GW2011_GWA1_50_15]|uniref:Ribosomal RNA small subunit methyltransferase A n=2 Tax=Bacteria division Kazan-3B-28 TaxID=1798534 RepID=A0A0G1ZGZ8_UNCK3|nr:MAG: dimethyladenosine transferase, 16S rRNA (adenine1518-N6/adenine1519-N6)-dimethyltransferase [candidate division Kazan bacterium GW2011_GWA1_50_15]KKW25803.1 MAG: Ribosomal RNA small subunit methyltransferase A [candidate division Kazan bacterium GW2011_GWC1_52_13]KKW27182.1 MAG: Ribosomal RNA small subunit methyltransferase A [candidate division Kazan bacterium GW2011_GWB1_52_7]
MDLTDIQTVKSLLTHYNLTAQKSLGQHFLIDAGALRTMLEAADLSKNDFVVEVGPGFGVLTLPVAERAGRVLAVETDKKLISILKALSSGTPNIDLLPANVLKLESRQLHDRYRQWSRVKSGRTRYKLVSNLPYYITSPILKQFLETSYRPDLIVVMVQREVAERIAAKPGEMSLLSVSVQFFGQPEIVRTVTKQSFWPKPEVDSAILKITPHPKLPWDVDDVRFFFRMVKAGFGERRKQLHNSLSGGLHIDDKLARNLLAGAGIDPKTRAQDLSVERWVKLYRQLKSTL